MKRSHGFWIYWGMSSLLFGYACNSNEFSSGPSRQEGPSNQGAANRIQASPPDQSPDKSGDTGQRVDTSAEAAAPSLAQDRIEKTKWQGCCPILRIFSSDVKGSPQTPNWAAKAYSRIGPFYFERQNENGYKVVKQMFEIYADKDCSQKLPASSVLKYKLTPMPKRTNASASISNLEVNDDGTRAEGLHLVNNIDSLFHDSIQQKVVYQIHGQKRLTETITVDDHSVIRDREYYLSVCEMTPMPSKNGD